MANVNRTVKNAEFCTTSNNLENSSSVQEMSALDDVEIVQVVSCEFSNDSSNLSRKNVSSNVDPSGNKTKSFVNTSSTLDSFNSSERKLKIVRNISVLDVGDSSSDDSILSLSPPEKTPLLKMNYLETNTAASKHSYLHHKKPENKDSSFAVNNSAQYNITTSLGNNKTDTSLHHVTSIGTENKCLDKNKLSQQPIKRHEEGNTGDLFAVLNDTNISNSENDTMNNFEEKNATDRDRANMMDYSGNCRDKMIRGSLLNISCTVDKQELQNCVMPAFNYSFISDVSDESLNINKKRSVNDFHDKLDISINSRDVHKFSSNELSSAKTDLSSSPPHLMSKYEKNHLSAASSNFAIPVRMSEAHETCDKQSSILDKRDQSLYFENEINSNNLEGKVDNHINSTDINLVNSPDQNTVSVKKQKEITPSTSYLVTQNQIIGESVKKCLSYRQMNFTPSGKLRKFKDCNNDQFNESLDYSFISDVTDGNVDSLICKETMPVIFASALENSEFSFIQDVFNYDEEWEGKPTDVDVKFSDQSFEKQNADCPSSKSMDNTTSIERQGNASLSENTNCLKYCDNIGSSLNKSELILNDSANANTPIDADSETTEESIQEVNESKSGKSSHGSGDSEFASALASQKSSLTGVSLDVDKKSEKKQNAYSSSSKSIDNATSFERQGNTSLSEDTNCLKYCENLDSSLNKSKLILNDSANAHTPGNTDSETTEESIQEVNESKSDKSSHGSRNPEFALSSQESSLTSVSLDMDKTHKENFKLINTDSKVNEKSIMKNVTCVDKIKSENISQQMNLASNLHTVEDNFRNDHTALDNVHDFRSLEKKNFRSPASKKINLSASSSNVNSSNRLCSILDLEKKPYCSDSRDTVQSVDSSFHTGNELLEPVPSSNKSDGTSLSFSESDYAFTLESQDSSFKSAFTNVGGGNNEVSQDSSFKSALTNIDSGNNGSSSQKLIKNICTPKIECSDFSEPMDISYANLLNYRDANTSLIDDEEFNEPPSLLLLDHDTEVKKETCENSQIPKLSYNQSKFKSSLLRPAKFNFRNTKTNNSPTKLFKMPSTNTLKLGNDSVNAKVSMDSANSKMPVSKIPKCTPLKRTPVTTPSTASTSSQRKKVLYNNIKSPVRAYIHNSSPVLVTKIKCGSEKLTVPTVSCEEHRGVASQIPTIHKAVAQKLTFENDRGTETTENIDPNIGRISLVPVNYKPASKKFLKENQDVQKKLPKLNAKFKKLLDTPKPKIVKHEGRVNVPPSEAGKLLTCNHEHSPIDLASRTEGDISVCATKTLFQTNAISK